MTHKERDNVLKFTINAISFVQHMRKAANDESSRYAGDLVAEGVVVLIRQLIEQTPELFRNVLR